MKKTIFITIISTILILISVVICIISCKPKTQLIEDLEEKIIIEEIPNELLITNENDEKIIGYITIEKIKLEKAPIAEGTDLGTINSYVGHFTESSYLDGNVCLCSHNRGGKGAYFGRLKELVQGDVITYITKFETKKYEVQEIKTIKDTDFSVIDNTENNQITLLTCVENVEDLRLCVVATEI